MHPSARIALLLLVAACGGTDAHPPAPARREAARPAAEADVVTETFGSDSDRGVFTLTRRGARHAVRVNGRSIWEGDADSVRTFALVQPHDGSALIVLEITRRGAGCGREFRVLEMQYQHAPRITPGFGTCSAAPSVRYVAERLRMDFGGGPALEYRDGVLDTLAITGRAGRVAKR